MRCYVCGLDNGSNRPDICYRCSKSPTPEDTTREDMCGGFGPPPKDLLEELKKLADKEEDREKCAVRDCLNTLKDGSFHGTVCTACYENHHVTLLQKVQTFDDDRDYLADLIKDVVVHLEEITFDHDTSLVNRCRNWLKSLNRDKNSERIKVLSDELLELGVPSHLVDNVRNSQSN